MEGSIHIALTLIAFIIYGYNFSNNGYECSANCTMIFLAGFIFFFYVNTSTHETICFKSSQRSGKEI